MKMTRTLQRVGVTKYHGGYEFKEILPNCAKPVMKWLTLATVNRKRDDIIRILYCPWPARLPPGWWSAAWAFVEAGLEHRSARTKWRGVRACLIHENFSAHQGIKERRSEPDLFWRPDHGGRLRGLPQK